MKIGSRRRCVHFAPLRLGLCSLCHRKVTITLISFDADTNEHMIGQIALFDPACGNMIAFKFIYRIKALISQQP